MRYERFVIASLVWIAGCAAQPQRDHGRASAARDGEARARGGEVPARDGEVLAPGVVLLRGAFVPGEQPDGNTVMLAGEDGWVVVDSGRHAAHTQRIIDAARASGEPVVAVVNTHWHLDHVSGNAMLRRAYPGLQVHASRAIEGALQGFLAGYRAQLQGAIEGGAGDEAQAAAWRDEIARIDAGAALLPDAPVTSAGERSLAGRRVRLGLVHDAVTAGDVWLFDPATRILVAGDLVTLPAPLFDTACPERWRSQLAALERVEFETLVPGHGRALERAELGRYRRAFEALLQCAGGTAEAQQCIDGWMTAARGLYDASEEALARSLLAYYVGQILRAPDAIRTRYCQP
jgi:glyoxylase-like metal-dependent hydrolase (beta-lactamase superfamily II)